VGEHERGDRGAARDRGDREGIGAPVRRVGAAAGAAPRGGTLAADHVDVDLAAPRTSASTIDPSTMRFHSGRAGLPIHDLAHIALARVGEDLLAHRRPLSVTVSAPATRRGAGSGSRGRGRPGAGGHARASRRTLRSTRRPAVGQTMTGSHELWRERARAHAHEDALSTGQVLPMAWSRR
jgi:hypothetical protein